MFAEFRKLLQRLYTWRQRRSFERLLLFMMLLSVWPFRMIVQSLLNSFFSRRPTRILIIQLAGLGDTLMLTPALAALQRNYPSARIDFITLHAYVKEAFQNHPRFHHITTLPVLPGQWIVSRFVNRSGARLLLTAMWCYPELLWQHFFARYELGINFALSDFDRNLGNALLYCLGVQSRVGSVGMNDKLLTTRATVNHLQTQRASAYLQFLQPLEISPASNAYEFPVQKNDLISVKVALICESVDLTKPLAVIHPGGKQHINSRRWPAEYFARVGEFLSAHQGFEIVLTGDESDVEVCEKIAGKPGKGIKSIAGRLTFAETAALLSISELFITNDTSALHLAEAVQVPRVISIFGPTDAELLAPRNHRHTVLKSKLPCAPCMGGSIDGNTERCWRDVKEECLWEITPAQVIDVLEHYYRKPAARVALA